MTKEQRFSSTVPAPLEGMPPLVAQGNSPASALRMEFDVTGAAAGELAQVLGTLRHALTELLPQAKLGPNAIRPVMEALADAERIAMQGRLLARIASGEVRHQNSQVRLDELLRQSLQQRHTAHRQRVTVRQTIRPARVVIDRDLAAALLDAALDWAMGEGTALEVTLEVKDWPANALLRLRTGGKTDSVGVERLCWHLVTEIGRSVGATIDRVRSAGETLVMIEFPRTLREMDGLSAMEVELGRPSAAADTSGVLAGHRALVVTSDVRLREEVKQICLEMGLTATSVPSSQLASQHCEREVPDIVVVDERFNDERFAQVRAHLLQGQANFPMVEIAYTSDVPLSMEGWASGGITRVGRNHIGNQLAQALVLEMSKVL
jgi:CheY-like chemotaxis protein